MSKSLVVCPFCNLEVPDGRYCKLCGKELYPEDSPVPEHIKHLEGDEPTPLVQEPLTTTSYPQFDITIIEMEHEASIVLLARAELDVVDHELDILIDKIKATRQALQLQKADKAILTARAEELRSDFEKTKNRRRELKTVVQPLVLEQLIEALDTHEGRLSKLESISGTVDKDVYKEQHTEIVSTLKELRGNLKIAIKTAKKWVSGIKKTIKLLEKEVSRVNAKFKIGDISRDT
ncbi:MAG: coiled-coil domain-containing protein, partial [Candidatus Thorarchaeota archaeon]